MNVMIKTEEELVSKFRESIRILANLRKFQKLWEENYSPEAKAMKKYWQEKADAFIKELDNPQIVIK